jgi:hypothetical protein
LDYLDYVFAFFQNCNHLADWVKYDAPGGAARVERLFANTVELRICPDICNATKHHTLEHTPKVEGGFADGREYVPSGWPTEHPVEGETWFVIAAGRKYDVFQLADCCMTAWDRFAADLTPR